MELKTSLEDFLLSHDFTRYQRIISEDDFNNLIRRLELCIENKSTLEYAFSWNSTPRELLPFEVKKRYNFWYHACCGNKEQVNKGKEVLEYWISILEADLSVDLDEYM